MLIPVTRIMIRLQNSVPTLGINGRQVDVEDLGTQKKNIKKHPGLLLGILRFISLPRIVAVCSVLNVSGTHLVQFHFQEFND